MYFLPSFFNVIVHLIVHLVNEIQWCDPVFLWYMYPFERYMGFLKGYVRNRHRPEGSIIEGYVVEEVIDFCTDYMTGIDSVGIPISRHEGRFLGVGTIGLKAVVPDGDLLEKAHLVILQHMTDVAPYMDEHMRFLRQAHSLRGEKWLINEHNLSFAKWLKERVKRHPDRVPVNETVEWLGEGPQLVVRTYQAYDINGYTFYTKAQDDKSTMQNSGVTLVATSEEFYIARDAKPMKLSKSYYGVIKEIWKVIYAKISIALFRCQWVENSSDVKVDNDGFTLVNLLRVGYPHDPFVLVKLATLVFYVTDLAIDKWRVVFSSKRHIVRVKDVVDEEEYDQFDEIPPFSNGI